MFPQLPFTPTTKVADPLLASYLRSQFTDKDGKVYRLLKISTDLANNAFAVGEVAFFKDDDTATNKASEADDTSNPRFAGVATAIMAESAGATDSTIYYGLFQFKGPVAGLSCAASVAIGDSLVTSLATGGTPVNGQAQRLAKATASNGAAVLVSHLGGATFIGSARTAISSGTCSAFLNGN